jgi:putative membrane protein
MIEILFVVIVAALHLYFFVLESFLWTSPHGLKVFGLSSEDAAKTKALATNQGVYNAFIAAGLIWSLLHPQGIVASQIAVFIMGCVVVAGVVGGLTISKKILWIQALPALIGLLVIIF